MAHSRHGLSQQALVDRCYLRVTPEKALPPSRAIPLCYGGVVVGAVVTLLLLKLTGWRRLGVLQRRTGVTGTPRAVPAHMESAVRKRSRYPAI